MICLIAVLTPEWVLHYTEFAFSALIKSRISVWEVLIIPRLFTDIPTGVWCVGGLSSLRQLLSVLGDLAATEY